VFALRQGKHRWVEITPFHRFYVKDIARIFPDASFIGVIRHPGAVAASRKKWGYDVLPVLEDWVTSTNRLLSECADFGQKKCHLLRYEDLVSTPQPVLENLLSFLDEPWSNAVLEHHAVQEAKGVDDVTTGGTRSGDAIDATRVDGWMAGLAPDEIELVRDTDRALMERCGYRSETALKRLPFNPESPLSAG